MVHRFQMEGWSSVVATCRPSLCFWNIWLKQNAKYYRLAKIIFVAFLWCSAEVLLLFIVFFLPPNKKRCLIEMQTDWAALFFSLGFEARVNCILLFEYLMLLFFPMALFFPLRHGVLGQIACKSAAYSIYQLESNFNTMQGDWYVICSFYILYSIGPLHIANYLPGISRHSRISVLRLSICCMASANILLFVISSKI